MTTRSRTPATARRAGICLGLLLLAWSALPAESQPGQQGAWPGLPPDCWTEVRNYVTDGDDWNWASRTKIERVTATRPDALTRSPNGAYYFALPGKEPRQSILVFAEKERFIRISFTEPKALNDVRWINEKLIYLRVWWGTVAATDLFFDVEQEKVVLAQSVHDGRNAMEQYRQGCRLQAGCQCVQKADR